MSAPSPPDLILKRTSLIRPQHVSRRALPARSFDHPRPAAIGFAPGMAARERRLFRRFNATAPIRN
jgi:hypothetical protein